MNRLVAVFIILAISFITFLGLVSSSLAETKPGTNMKPAPERIVHVLTVNGVINAAAAEYVQKSLDKAAESGAELCVIELDTPGGLDTSMRSIVKAMNASSVPVAVYVSPSGARAASAGVFITIAAHVAAMAPGTNIGAAHPVAVGEKMDKVSSEKATNDAVAYIRSIAEQRGRNAQWAEQAVRKSVSVTEKEAVSLRVIDLTPADLPALLSSVSGWTVRTAAGERTLMTAGAKIVRVEKGIRHRILDLIGDPTVAYLLMLLGFYGIFFELTNPGTVLPGVLGGIFLVLAFYAFQTLPVNYAGLLLIIIGLVLFILEVKITSYGMLTIGGILSIVLGSLMLFDSPLPVFKLSLTVVLPAALVTAVFFAVTIRLAYRAVRRKPVTGAEGLVGMTGVAKTDLTGSGGMVLVHGEFWTAESPVPVKTGEQVVVEAVDGLRLRVKPKFP
ncbi:MAG TPA: nodulation protein NfeD [Dissulfurispiraceae bacterium]|nr:nodulation protein NfeD [Dissulfurispiraceae bacterium]